MGAPHWGWGGWGGGGVTQVPFLSFPSSPETIHAQIIQGQRHHSNYMIYESYDPLCKNIKDLTFGKCLAVVETGVNLIPKKIDNHFESYKSVVHIDKSVTDLLAAVITV